jgi:hypothetical protein
MTLAVAAPVSAEWFADLYQRRRVLGRPQHPDVGNGSVSGNRGKSVADFTWAVDSDTG